MCKNYFSQICIENCSRMNKYLFLQCKHRKESKDKKPYERNNDSGPTTVIWNYLYRFDNSQDVIQDHGTTLIHQDHNHKIFNYNQNP